MGFQELYASSGIRISDDGYVQGAYSYTSTDWEVEQTIELNDFCGKNGIDFLYVNYPIKYMDDNYMLEQFGVESYANRNADCFLERITDAKIHNLDIRSCMIQDNINIQDMFYRTDHHWKTTAGLYAAEHISNYLNENCNYGIDNKIFDISNYDVTEYRNCWLGEQGRKVSEKYIGLDDFTELKPNFATYYNYQYDDGTNVGGDFSILLDESIFDAQTDVYNTSSWHYAYMPGKINNAKITNLNMAENDKHILIIGDSYSYVVVPFLINGVREIDTLIRRGNNATIDLKEYILKGNYDAIIVCYAQSMIGSHDKDSSNANYYLFDFMN